MAIQFSPITVTYTKYSVRVRRNGKFNPMIDPCDTLREAKELAERKAASLSLPVYHVRGEDGAEAIRDGVFIVETRQTAETRETWR